MFEVIIPPRARKASKKLPEHYKRRIAEFLLILQENPVPAERYDMEKLGGHKDTFRARIGDIRIIYGIRWDEKEIRILSIKPRETAYK